MFLQGPRRKAGVDNRMHKLSWCVSSDFQLASHRGQREIYATCIHVENDIRRQFVFSSFHWSHLQFKPHAVMYLVVLECDMVFIYGIPVELNVKWIVKIHRVSLTISSFFKKVAIQARRLDWLEIHVRTTFEFSAFRDEYPAGLPPASSNHQRCHPHCISPESSFPICRSALPRSWLWVNDVDDVVSCSAVIVARFGCKCKPNFCRSLVDSNKQCDRGRWWW